jgi:hypothetical protein
MFGMEHQQIQGVIRDWLEETYNLKGITPYSIIIKSHIWLEETYNLKGITPVYFDDEETRELEETYNLKKK